MSKCLLCESEDWYDYCSIENKKYSVVICRSCSFTELNPKPTEDELNKFYSELYRKKYSNQNEVTEDVIAYEQLRANRIVTVIKEYFKNSYSNILDIGCSSGTLLKNISNLSLKPVLYGIEMNDNYRKYIINNKIADKDKISNDDINEYYKDKENKFDFISIVHVLEHLRHPKKTLESIYKLLKDDGIMYIEVPNLKTPYNNLKKEYFAIYHLYYFTEKTLRYLLEITGFEIIKEQQIANTSICFVCKKVVECKPKIIDNNEFDIVINNLRKYEKKISFLYMREILVKIIIFMGLKSIIKKIFRR